MRVGLRLVLALTMLAVVPALAQERPDFSGEWARVEPADSTALLSVVQTGYFITISNQSADGPRSDTYTLGTESGFVGGVIDARLADSTTTSVAWSAVWKESTLVVTRTQSAIQNGVKTPLSSREEVWSLDSDGRLAVVITDEQTAAALSTTRFVYRKRR
jgi:hypothetical protein